MNEIKRKRKVCRVNQRKKSNAHMPEVSGFVTQVVVEWVSGGAKEGE